MAFLAALAVREVLEPMVLALAEANRLRVEVAQLALQVEPLLLRIEQTHQASEVQSQQQPQRPHQLQRQ